MIGFCCAVIDILIVNPAERISGCVGHPQSHKLNIWLSGDHCHGDVTCQPFAAHASAGVVLRVPTTTQSGGHTYPRTLPMSVPWRLFSLRQMLALIGHIRGLSLHQARTAVCSMCGRRIRNLLALWSGHHRAGVACFGQTVSSCLLCMFRVRPVSWWPSFHTWCTEQVLTSTFMPCRVWNLTGCGLWLSVESIVCGIFMLAMHHAARCALSTSLQRRARWSVVVWSAATTAIIWVALSEVVLPCDACRATTEEKHDWLEEVCYWFCCKCRRISLITAWIS